jgi:hypothetical protein
MECAIVELRQYTLHPGRRDELIDLFEREFLEPQDAAGMTLIGQFRMLGNDDRFVWLRGFADMESRPAALAAFYDGSVWAAHRDAANATMVDSDNVLLLQRARTDSGFAVSQGQPFPSDAEEPPGRVYVAGVSQFGEPANDEEIARLEAAVARTVGDCGGRVLSWHVTEQSANNYPRLPVREDVNAVVWVAVFPDVTRAEECRTSPALRILDRLETLTLIPTSRSRLR